MDAEKYFRESRETGLAEIQLMWLFEPNEDLDKASIEDLELDIKKQKQALALGTPPEQAMTILKNSTYVWVCKR